MDSWKKIKERTTAAPGTAFSHLKAIEKGSTAAIVFSIMAVLPLLVRFAPVAWCTLVASMISKKKEDLRPEKLQLITLLHALFNHNNKWAGKEIMKFGGKHNRLANEQYGSRKKKSAGQHALNKRLILDHIRLQKLCALLIANDVWSCYDRIIIMVSYTTMVLFGIQRATAKCLLECLLLMLYFIQTVFGDSDISYRGTSWIRKSHGNGQGNGTRPSLWAGISSLMYKILRQEGYGVKLQGAISNTTMETTGLDLWMT